MIGFAFLNNSVSCWWVFSDATPEPELELGPTKTVEMMLVLGGMDTEGEVFDDCLLYLLKDLGEKETQSTDGADVEGAHHEGLRK